RAQGTFWITDMDSRNGLHYDGRRISRKAMADGDVLYIGKDVALEFREHIGFQPVAPRPTLPPSQTLRLTEDTITIGRAKDNTMVIDHPQVSRYHALVERLGMRQRIKDLKSSNGVFVNGERIETEAWLEEEDEIRIGPCRLRVGENVLARVAEEGLRIDALRLQKWVSRKLNLLEDISLSVYPQEFVALVGLSGAGKSTLMDALNGFRPATHGVVFVNNVNLYRKFDLFRNDMGYVPQQDIVHTQLTVYQALDYAAQLRMPSDTRSSERHRRIVEVLEELDLSERKDMPIHKLSGGQLKRVSIGVELLTKPRLFFLDEPTSGLDPGTEYNMMRLLRKLADQGRTIVLITHATKNVMMCDKVIILVRGGHLAYYGPPEQALSYFDQFRTDHERRIKDVEFDDIYTILEDEERGTSEEWAERYRHSPHYVDNVVSRLSERESRTPAADSPTGVTASQLRQKATKGVSSLRQFLVLSRRNLRIMASDRATMGLMLALAPLLSVMETAGRGMFDPVTGNAADIITTLFLSGLISYLVGALTSVREIVKEIDIYKRERAINLKLAPYVVSKVWVGFVLAVYTGVIFVVIRQGVMTGLWPSTVIGFGTLGWTGYVAFFITFFLSSLSGYLMGLFISAVSPNQNVAILLVIVALVPQFLLAGGMMPLDLLGAGGEIVSRAVSNRWAFEAGVNITGIGTPLVEDPCWDSLDKAGEGGEMGWNDHLNLSNEEKKAAGCLCMGPSVFTGPCSRFPGILNDDYYTGEAKQTLAQPEPVKPEQPTPHPTLTPYPTLTPLPTPSNPADFDAYMDDMQAQGDEYQSLREAQGEDYQDMRGQQGDEYEAAMEVYSDDFAEWQQSREQAIGGAEGMLKGIFETYGQTFRGRYTTRWFSMLVIIASTMLLIIVSQKRKDPV
ncbi:MAG: ATP-binding cassette domain-containing protein, partial [Anaerolineae bacterium]